jgi:DNA-binding CsgD family transcriptional regulator/tetratricopeptide (TPR) repeat protein
LHGTVHRRPRAAALVGRAEELALLVRLVDDARQGAGGAVVVRGEAGVGKSRLLAEAAAAARERGCAVATGRAVEGGGPYRPLADALLAASRTGELPGPEVAGPFAGALGRLVPGWADAGEVGPTDLTLLVSEGLLRVLRALGDGRGALLVLDDLHWADPDTLTVIDRLAEAVADLPVLLLLAAREQPVPALDRSVVHAVPLRRLGADDAAQLARACAGGLPLPEPVDRHLAAHAEGLPFLVEELVAGLVDAGTMLRTAAGWELTGPLRKHVPASIAAVVDSRLAGLPVPARAVVEAAAVLGRQLDWRHLPAVTGQHEAQVLEALRLGVERGLLTTGPEDPDLFRFGHALTREAVLTRLLPPQHAALAGRAAAVVRDDDPVLAAGLAEQAGNHAAAAALLLTAAERTGAALATREDLLRRAAALAPDDVDVAVALVETLVLGGRAVDALELGDPLLERLPPDDLRRPPLARTLVRACLTAVRREPVDRYLAAAGTGPESDALAASVAFAHLRTDEAVRLAEAAVAAGSPRVQCEALELLGRVARAQDRRDDAEAAFSRALHVAEREDLPLQRARALHELGTLDLLGPARRDRLEAAREAAVRTGQLSLAAVLDLHITAVHGLHMEHARTAASADRCIELAESLRLDVVAGVARVFAAMAAGHTGSTDRMHELLDDAERILSGRDWPQYASSRYVRGTPYLVAHDLERLLPFLEEGTAVHRQHGSAAPSPYRGLHALVATVLSDGTDVREQLRTSGTTAQAANRAALAYADAVAAARAGRDPSALLAEAERAMAPLTWRRHHARLLVAPSALRDGWGSPVEWLREGAAHFASVGDPALARACRDVLRAAGAAVPRRGRGESSVPPHLAALGVTSREADVLALVAEGLTNAAIAARLVLSPRTVETHVANLLAKTGAGSRAALAKSVALPG